MVRRAVAFYMALVLTAGPGLCCCPAAHLAARSTPPAAEPAAPPACPHCAAHHPAADDSPPAEPAGDHHCPCQEKDKPAATAGDPAATTAQQLARLLAWAGEVVALADPVARVRPLAEAVGSTSPPGHRSVTHLLLDRHHQLRC